MTDKDPKTGRFVKGNKASPGRRPRVTEEEYADAFFETISIVRFKKIIEATAKSAERGNMAAVKLIIERVLPAIEKHELTGKDGAPMEIRTFDYASAIAAITTGSSEDSDTSGEG